jgi:hypothetical protein
MITTDIAFSAEALILKLQLESSNPLRVGALNRRRRVAKRKNEDPQSSCTAVWGAGLVITTDTAFSAKALMLKLQLESSDPLDVGALNRERKEAEGNNAASPKAAALQLAAPVP